MRGVRLKVDVKGVHEAIQVFAQSEKREEPMVDTVGPRPHLSTNGDKATQLQIQFSPCDERKPQGILYFVVI